VDLSLRPISPHDAEALTRHWASLSPESQRRRFLASKPTLTPAELRFLTDLDFVDHVAWVATPADDAGLILGVGRFVRLAPHADVAEFAIAVADEWQGRGIGSRIAAKLVEEALALGIRRFTATMFADNRAVRRILARLASHLEYERNHGSVDELVFALAA
jgi:RimJ/RimL family protein N-acetyltransferase